MNKYYKFKQYPNDFYVISDNILYHYFAVSSNSRLYRVRSKANVNHVMDAVGDKLEEISETAFLRQIIAKGVFEVE